MASLTPPTNSPIPHTEFTPSQVECGSESFDSHDVVASLFRKYIPSYEDLPSIKLHCNECIDNGYIHLIPYDLKGNSSIKGEDGYGRHFVAYATFSRSKKITCVNVIFQRYIDSTAIVSSCFTRGRALGHDQLFSATPKIEDARESILSLLRGQHPYWKLQNT